MNIYVESFEAYTAQHPLNEGLLTVSIKDKELSAKDGIFGGFNIAKLKSPIVTKNIKKDLDRYMEIGRKMVDDQAPNLKDENGNEMKTILTTICIIANLSCRKIWFKV